MTTDATEPTMLDMLAPSLDRTGPTAALCQTDGHVVTLILNGRRPDEHELALAGAVYLTLERGLLAVV